MSGISRGDSPSRILIIQLRQIGDVIMTTPALRALRAACPNAHIAYLTEQAAAPIVETISEVDEVIVSKRTPSPIALMALVSKLRANKYDLVIDFLANPRTTLLARWSGAEVTLAADNSRRATRYTITTKPTGYYSAAQKLSLLSALDIIDDDCSLSLLVNERARESIDKFFGKIGLNANSSPLVCMDVTHRRVTRCWTPEGFASVADALYEKYGAAVVFLESPGEADVVKHVRSLCRHEHVQSFRTTLPELVALLARADLCIGNDSAPRHIATAVDTATVTIHGSNRVENWTPPKEYGGGSKHRIVVRENLDCRPCHKNICTVPGMPCLNEVTPEMVLNVVDDVLQGGSK